MFGDVVIDADARDPQIVVLRGQVSRACEAQLTAAVGRAARHGRCRLDLTALDGLHRGALEMLRAVAASVDLDLIVRAGSPIARAGRGVGLGTAEPGCARVRTQEVRDAKPEVHK
jgi:hypothetical protein